MNNYEHEIKINKNRLMKYFLINDYFHDSIIKEIGIVDDNKKLLIKLSCEREWSNYDLKQYIDDLNYEYHLEFKDCIYIEIEKNNDSKYIEYLNGRFKNSSKIKEIIKNTKRKYYHFRIQTSTGYIDAIFRKFDIKKSIGEIQIPKRIENEYYFDFIKRKFSEKDITEIKYTAENGKGILKSYALEYLWLANQDDIESIAEKLLQNEDTEISAIFIIGETGNIKHLKQLNKIYEEDRSAIFKRHVKDAIEKIILRV